ncbi:MAG: hypothetical protein V1253_01070 [Alphaproteobacteria bacterium]|nr:hypothetical protein [Alphaproteobacteria bacterium]
MAGKSSLFLYVIAGIFFVVTFVGVDVGGMLSSVASDLSLHVQFANPASATQLDSEFYSRLAEGARESKAMARRTAAGHLIDARANRENARVLRERAKKDAKSSRQRARQRADEIRKRRKYNEKLPKSLAKINEKRDKEINKINEKYAKEQAKADKEYAERSEEMARKSDREAIKSDILAKRSLRRAQIAGREARAFDKKSRKAKDDETRARHTAVLIDPNTVFHRLYIVGEPNNDKERDGWAEDAEEMKECLEVDWPPIEPDTLT